MTADEKWDEAWDSMRARFPEIQVTRAYEIATLLGEKRGFRPCVITTPEEINVLWDCDTWRVSVHVERDGEIVWAVIHIPSFDRKNGGWGESYDVGTVTQGIQEVLAKEVSNA